MGHAPPFVIFPVPRFFASHASPLAYSNHPLPRSALLRAPPNRLAMAARGANPLITFAKPLVKVESIKLLSPVGAAVYIWDMALIFFLFSPFTLLLLLLHAAPPSLRS